MKRILILFALCTQALAGPVYVYTNDVNTLDRAAHPITMQSGAETRYTITATRSTNALNLTDLVGVWTITDPRDAAQLAAYTGTVLSASRGLIRFTATPPATMEQGVTYDGLARLTIGTSVIAQIAYDYVMLAGPACSTCSAGSGGSGTTIVNITNVAGSTTYDYSTNIFQQIVNVSNSYVVSAGPTSINGISSGTLTVKAQGYGIRIETNGQEIIATSDIAYPTAPGQLLQSADGVSNYWASLGVVPGTFTPGTNLHRWAGGLITNAYSMEATQQLFRLYGASGGVYSCPGGYVEGVVNLPIGTPLKVLCGYRGNLNSAAWSTNTPYGYPFGGMGNYGTASNRINGGGATVLFMGDVIATNGTNILLLAPGSAGGGANAYATGGGAPGGGYPHGAMDAAPLDTTNLTVGLGAWASNVYGLAATAGINTSSTFASGGLLTGGNSFPYPSGATTGALDTIGGGGGGFMSGASGTKRSTSTAAVVAPGGGGLAYANSNYVTQARTYRAAQTVGGAPPGSEFRAYTAGYSVGAVNSSGTDGAAGTEF